MMNDSGELPNPATGVDAAMSFDDRYRVSVVLNLDGSLPEHDAERVRSRILDTLTAEGLYPDASTFQLGADAALVAPREPLAHQFFAMCQLENELDDAIVTAFGANPEETETWPFSHIVYDWYDSSFEVWNTRNDFEATDDHLRAVFALGFAHGWICFKDGTEIFIDKKLKRNARRVSTIPRDSEDKYREAKSAALVAGLRQALHGPTLKEMAMLEEKPSCWCDALRAAGVGGAAKCPPCVAREYAGVLVGLRALIAHTPYYFDTYASLTGAKTTTPFVLVSDLEKLVAASRPGLETTHDS
jgi:hypothetical protein